MAQFRSKIGLIAATIGSAVGLGTVWRFPAETQANGGAAFLVIYILFVFLLGVPIMLGEFAVGRAGRSDVIADYVRLSPRRRQWGWVGFGALLASYLILCFYMVVGGWTFEYLVASVNGDLFSVLGDSASNVSIDTYDSFFTRRMREYVMTSYSPLYYTLGFVVINILILVGGVQKGIERMSNIMMPLLFVLLVAFAIVALNLPGAGDGVRFFLSPDFSKITPAVCISALGQALFSLSLGMGILITYAGYFPDDTRLTRTSVIVVSMTLLVAILMGLIIFPAVSSFGLADHGLKGTTLVFVTLPEVFAMLPASSFWSALFFVLLMMAALTSTVSISEVTIRLMEDRFGFSRVKATVTALVPLFVFSGICALSFGELSWMKIGGMVVFDFLDTLTNNYLLPVVAFAGSLYVGWFGPSHLITDQLGNHGTLSTPAAQAIVFILRYVAPAAIAAIIVSNLI